MSEIDRRHLSRRQQRAETLAALECVDLITLFDEPTPLRLVQQAKPDVLVKGSEYAEEDIVGAREIRSWGGDVIRVPMRAGWSTSAIIDAIKRESQ